MSDKERKYRLKIIQELHYDKKEQSILDNYKVNKEDTYEKIYSALRCGECLSLQLIIGTNRLNKAVCNMGGTVKQFVENCAKLCNAVAESEVFKGEAR